MSLRTDTPAPGVLGLWLDRPERRNALDRVLVEAILDALAAVSARAVVLGSTDPACFCGGADLGLGERELTEVSDLLYELYGRMLALPVPIVLAAGGHAVGGGAQLLLAGDVRIGTPATRIRFAGLGHGLAVGAWGLPSLVGRGRALELCLSMRTAPADEALAIGLLDRVEEDAAKAAVELAAAIARLDGDATRRAKAIVRDAAGLVTALEQERAGNRAAWTGSTAGLRPPEG